MSVSKMRWLESWAAQAENNLRRELIDSPDRLAPPVKSRGAFSIHLEKRPFRRIPAATSLRRSCRRGEVF